MAQLFLIPAQPLLAMQITVQQLHLPLSCSNYLVFFQSLNQLNTWQLIEWQRLWWRQLQFQGQRGCIALHQILYQWLIHLYCKQKILWHLLTLHSEAPSRYPWFHLIVRLELLKFFYPNLARGIDTQRQAQHLQGFVPIFQLHIYQPSLRYMQCHKQ